MSKRLLILVALCAPLSAWAFTAGPPQVQSGCTCTQDANYTDAGEEWPACVETFGLSWSPIQAGICAKEGCPKDRPCKGDLTVSATGDCNWGILAVEPGLSTMAFFDGSWSVTIPYAMDCGEQWKFHWHAEDTFLGSHSFVCKNCKGGLGGQ